MVIIKVSGITTVEDALLCESLGIDMIGVILSPGNNRYIPIEKARNIFESLKTDLKKVAIVMNPTHHYVNFIINNLPIDLLQFSGNESPEFCNSYASRFIKHIRVESEKDLYQIEHYKAEAFIIDGKPPLGKFGFDVPFDYNLARKAKGKGTIFIAGKLSLEKLEKVIRSVRPHGIDLIATVEKTTGKKSRELLEKYVEILKK